MPNDGAEFGCTCGKVFITIDKLKHHQRYYCRPPDPEEDVCKLCGRSFKCYAGVRQHLRRAYPQEYNEGLQDEDRRRHRPLAAMENLALVRAELAYGGYNINQHLSTLFPDRTIEMIKSHRRGQEYKNLRDRIRAEIEEAGEDGPEEAPSNVSQAIHDNIEFELSHNMPVLPDDGAPAVPPVLIEGHIDITPTPALSPSVSPPSSPPSSSPPRPQSPHTPSDLADPVREFINTLISNMDLKATWILPINIIFDPTSTEAQIQGCIDRLWGLTVDVGSTDRERQDRHAPRDPPSLNNRRQRYAYVQRLYKKDRARLAEGLLNGSLYTNPIPTFTAETAFNAYNEIFGAESPPNNSYITDPINSEVEIYKPITADELRTFLNARQSDAKGPDNIRISQLRKVSLEELLVLFNLVLFSSTIPSGWRLNRTILIPKSGGDSADIDAWRQLTVSSAGLRLFNKVLAARFSQLPLCKEQRGFQRVDGTLANTLTLQGVIKDFEAHARPFSISTPHAVQADIGRNHQTS